MAIRIQCRDHAGGIFEIQPRMGRRPVRCTGDNPCDHAGQKVSNTIRQVPGIGKVAVVSAESVAKAPTAINDSLPLAMRAKERLSAVGWVVKGRAWVMDMTGWQMAEVTASRGAETLVITWQDGVLNEQTYAMEDINPAKNDYPPSQLSFDPDELTDSELVRMIKGMKVSWWNTIASSTESAVIGGTVTVEHIFFVNGDEDNSKRVVKFIDHSGGGFRAFHVGALLKVG